MSRHFAFVPSTISDIARPKNSRLKCRKKARWVEKIGGDFSSLGIARGVKLPDFKRGSMPQ